MASNEIDAEDPAARRTIINRPAGMEAGIATDQGAVMHCEPVRVRRTWFKLRSFQHAAGGGFVPDESGAVIGIALAIIAHDLPDGAVVPGGRMIPRLIRRLIERDHEFRLPGVRIDAQKSAQPERRNPELAVLPKSAVAAPSV